MTPEDLANFKNWGVPLPSRQPHAKDEELSGLLQKPELTNWRLEGNILKATSQLGEHGWFLPSDYKMDGIDDKGAPILTRIKV